MRRELYTTGLQVREAPEGNRIEGYAIMFGVSSAPFVSNDDEEIREVIAPEAVTRELLDASDIKMTMYHNREKLLARSNRGEGTLSYGVDGDGVRFSFTVPDTQTGREALELVRRGDIDGCSFAFTTDYRNRANVSRETTKENGRSVTTYTVRKMSGIYDFTITPDPAYPATTVAAREGDADFAAFLKEERDADRAQREQEIRAQISEMRQKIE